jgi:protein fantom
VYKALTTSELFSLATLQDLDRALSIVKRRTEAVKGMEFLQQVEGETLDSVSELRRKLETVLVANMNLSQDSERLQRMLDNQVAINREHAAELEELTREQLRDKSDLAQRARDFEALAEKRQQKIETLEAQVRELVYASTSGKKKQKRQQTSTTHDEVASAASSENTLLDEVIMEGGFGPDENLVEMWVRQAAFREAVLRPGGSTFVTFDFFDYETQVTPVLVGANPQYEFAAAYKVTVDDFFLRCLATDTLVLEAFEAVQGDHLLVGRAAMPLAGLLRTRPRVSHAALPLLSPADGSVVAHVEAQVRLALPVTELYRLFLERNPIEMARIKELNERRWPLLWGNTLC